MSIHLDPNHSNPAVDEALVATGTGLRPTSSPVAFSISCWMYFPSLPEAEDYGIVWWYGDPTASSTRDRWVRLEIDYRNL
jgi:hypothetical protein